MNCLILILILGLASWLLVYGIRGWAKRNEILDVPNHRSSHTQPTPVGGGLAIVAICMIGSVAYWFYRPGCSPLVLASYSLGAGLIAISSWIDDLRTLSSPIRFLVHSLGAILILAGGSYWDAVTVPLVGHVDLGWLGLAISFFWIVGLTNSYNFMDGIDGIAGTQAVVAGFGWLVLGTVAGQPLLSTFGLLLAASSLGFLIHNRPPAKIFMGDVGSAFLGYTFAFLAIIAAQTDARLALAGVLLVWPFVFDTILTFSCRLYRGENAFSAHRTHLYQRLVRCGWTHGSVTSLYASLSLVGFLLALSFNRWPGLSDWPVICSVAVMGGGLWVLVNRVESKNLAVAGGAEPNIHQIPILQPVDNAVTLREGRHLTLISTEAMLTTALSAADVLNNRGFRTRVLGMPTGKPAETAGLRAAARETRLIITLEEPDAVGWLGSAVVQILRQAQIPDVRCYHIRLGSSSDGATAGLEPSDEAYDGVNTDAVVNRLEQILKHDFHPVEQALQDELLKEKRAASGKRVVLSQTAADKPESL